MRSLKNYVSTQPRQEFMLNALNLLLQGYRVLPQVVFFF